MSDSPDYNSYYSIEQLDKELSSTNQLNRIREVAMQCEGSVLDLGAGLGKLGVMLKELGKIPNINYPEEYLAIDIKKNYVKYIVEQLKLKAIVEDSRNLKFFKNPPFLILVCICFSILSLERVLPKLDNPIFFTILLFPSNLRNNCRINHLFLLLLFLYKICI